MELNSCYKIQLSYKHAGGPVSSIPLAPEDFFDAGFLQTHNVDSIPNDAPWLYDDLRNFACAESDSASIEWIRLDILDERTKEQRRVEQQSWSGHWISVDWGTCPSNAPSCVIILRLKESGGSAFQVVKLALSPLEFAIRGHSLYEGKDPGNPVSILYFDGYDKTP